LSFETSKPYKVSKIKSDMERELPNGDVIQYAYEIKTKSI